MRRNIGIPTAAVEHNLKRWKFHAAAVSFSRFPAACDIDNKASSGSTVESQIM